MISFFFFLLGMCLGVILTLAYIKLFAWLNPSKIEEDIASIRHALNTLNTKPKFMS